MKKLITILVFFLSINVNAAETLKSIPADFLGKWAPSLKRCEPHPVVGGDDPELFTITANYIKYYESGCSYASIVRRNKNEIAMILECGGMDEEWLNYKHFTISKDKKIINDIASPVDKTSYYKCTK